jgi:hypothetical protein
MKLAYAARFCLCLTLSAGLLGLALLPLPAQAGAVFNVACGDAAGLIQAIADAHDEAANPGQDTIILAPNCTIPYTFSVGYPGNLNDAVPDITTSISIIGNGAILERSYAPDTPLFRLFDVKAGGELILDWVTIRNFSSSYGAAIVNYGNAVVTNSTFEGNAASSYAGAIATRQIMHIENSTFFGNSATTIWGGAIENWRPAGFEGILTMVNVTLTNNSAPSGGGLYNDDNATTTIINSTIARNTATNNGGGGGVYNDTIGTSLVVRNSIFESNTNGNCNSVLVGNEGGNIQWGDSTCGGGIPAANPYLAPLENNGGLVKTMALGANSLARETGVLPHCPAADARGVSRPQPTGTLCDSGAYENEVPRYFTTHPRFEPASAVVGQPTLFKFDITNVYSTQLSAVDVLAILPENMTITGEPSMQGVCTFGMSAPLGTRSIHYAGGTVPVGQTCSFEIQVTAWKPGTQALEYGQVETAMTPIYPMYLGSTLAVSPASTRTDLEVAKGSGTGINLTARVRPVSPGAGTASGQVVFY